MTPNKIETEYQEVSDRVGKKLEGLYHSMDANEKRVLDSILNSKRPPVSQATTVVKTPIRVRTEGLVDIIADVACW